MVNGSRYEKMQSELGRTAVMQASLEAEVFWSGMKCVCVNHF